MKTKVSVIIPVYNAERYLRSCLDSVVGQSLRDIEIICIDDGSTDGSKEILSEYKNGDVRITITTQDNHGPAAARNAGLDMASGEYVQFLDADDYFEPTMLEDMYITASRHGADIVICKTQQFDSESGRDIPSGWMLRCEGLPGGAFAPTVIADRLFQFTDGQVWDKLFSRTFLEEMGLHFPKLRASEDVPFTFEALLLSRRICIVPKVMVHYRVNAAGSVSKSFQRYPDAPIDAFRMVYDFLNDNGLTQVYERSFRAWSAEYLPWQVCNAPSVEIGRRYYEAFHDEWADKLRIDRDVMAGLSRADLVRYLCVRYLPYGTLRGAAATYRALKRTLVRTK